MCTKIIYADLHFWKKEEHALTKGMQQLFLNACLVCDISDNMLGI
jgi:hypothetical protein